VIAELYQTIQKCYREKMVSRIVDEYDKRCMLIASAVFHDTQLNFEDKAVICSELLMPYVMKCVTVYIEITAMM